MAPEVIVLRSVKQVGLPIQTVVDEKLVVGRGLTVTGCCIVSLHPNELVAINVIVNVPGELYV